MVVDAGYSSDQEPDRALLFHFYRARFQIEFTVREAKQHLGLHNGQAQFQAKLDFHFSVVFAVFFWAPYRLGSRRTVPWGPHPASNQARRLRGRHP